MADEPTLRDIENQIASISREIIKARAASRYWDTEFKDMGKELAKVGKGVKDIGDTISIHFSKIHIEPFKHLQERMEHISQAQNEYVMAQKIDADIEHQIYQTQLKKFNLMARAEKLKSARSKEAVGYEVQIAEQELTILGRQKTSAEEYLAIAIDKYNISQKEFGVLAQTTKLWEFTRKQVAGIFGPLSIVSVTILGFMLKQVYSLNNYFSQANTSLRTRTNLLNTANDIQFETGASLDRIGKAQETILDLGIKDNANRSDTVKTIVELNKALKVSEETSVKILTLSGTIGANFKNTGDSIAYLVQRMNLTGTEASNLALELSKINQRLGNSNVHVDDLVASVGVFSSHIKAMGGDADMVTKMLESFSTLQGAGIARYFGGTAGIFDPKAFSNATALSQMIMNASLRLRQVPEGNTAYLTQMGKMMNLDIGQAQYLRRISSPEEAKKIAEEWTAALKQQNRSGELAKLYNEQLAQTGGIYKQLINLLLVLVRMGLGPFIWAVNWLMRGISWLVDKLKSLAEKTHTVWLLTGTLTIAFGVVLVRAIDKVIFHVGLLYKSFNLLCKKLLELTAAAEAAALAGAGGAAKKAAEVAAGAIAAEAVPTSIKMKVWLWTMRQLGTTWGILLKYGRMLIPVITGLCGFLWAVGRAIVALILGLNPFSLIVMALVGALIAVVHWVGGWKQAWENIKESFTWIGKQFMALAKYAGPIGWVIDGVIKLVQWLLKINPWHNEPKSIPSPYVVAANRITQSATAGVRGSEYSIKTDYMGVRQIKPGNVAPAMDKESTDRIVKEIIKHQQLTKEGHDKQAKTTVDVANRDRMTNSVNSLHDLSRTNTISAW